MPAKKATQAKWQYIPYKGGSLAVGDTVAGQTQVVMNGMLATLPFVQSGKLKVLGVSKSTRVPLLPDVPTIAEQGIPGFESGTWQGVLVPVGTPPAIIAKLEAEDAAREATARREAEDRARRDAEEQIPREAVRLGIVAGHRRRERARRTRHRVQGQGQLQVQ